MLSWLTGSSNKLPYEPGETIVNDFSVTPWWTLKEATKKADNSTVSMFECDLKANSNRAELAKNAYKKIKTLRHPYILSWTDGVETEDKLVVITEPVRPLAHVINEIEEWTETESNLVAWGCYQVAKALAFLNDEAKVHHGNINIGSIFVTQGGDWKIAGLDFVSTVNDGNSLLMKFSSSIPTKYVPPELATRAGATWQTVPPTNSCLDSWQIGCLLREAFGGVISSPKDLTDVASVPKKLQTGYTRLLNKSPTKRLKPKALLECPFFANPYVKTCLFLENLAIKDSYERDSFFKALPKIIDQLPVSCQRYKLLPEILKSLEFAGTSNWNLLASLLKVSAHLPQEEYATKIAPVVVKYFAVQDRGLRITLLQNLDSFIDNLTPSLVDSKLFPSIATGFGDSNPQLRELTVKSMLLLVPKLTTATVDNKLLAHFAKLQVDREPGIRTNTTICLGRIAPSLTSATRRKILVPAFSRALRDPFAPGRSAGLAALCATMRYYTADDLAKKVVPAVSALCVDAEKQVRDKAFDVVRQFVNRLEQLANGLPDTQEEAEKAAADQSSMLGWLSKRIYGKDEGAAEPPDATQQQKQSNTQNDSASKSTKSATTTAPAQSPSSSSKPSSTQPKKKAGSGLKVAGAKKIAKTDGWDEDWDLDDDEPTTNTSSHIEKAKSPYIGMDDAEEDDDVAGDNDGWDNDIDFDDEEDDGQWDFTPSKTVSAPKSSSSSLSMRSRSVKKAD